MARVYSISFLVGSGALLFALLLIHTIVPAMGEAIQPSMLICAFVGSYSIGSPVAYVMAMQNRRLHKVLQELEQAHGELEAAHRRLEARASRDPLTGLLNREFFFDAVARLRQAGDAGTLLIVDADHFKQVNDHWGHLKGDEALRLIARAIGQSLRACDVVGRIGGEEFCAYLPHTTGVEAGRIAERIRAAVSEIEFRPEEGSSWPLSVSVGGAAATGGLSMSQLIRAADMRLYDAKRSGRNRTSMGSELLRAA